MTLQQIRHFLAIIETGSISLAAQRCHISQPSMSASLRKLEEELGDALFLRHPHGLTPTPEGRHFLQHARKVMQAVEEARTSLRDATARPRGRLRVGVTETVSAYLLPKLLRQGAAPLRGIELAFREMRREELELRVEGADLDVGLLVMDNLSPGRALREDVLVESPRRLWLPVGHSLLQRERIRLAEVAGHPFVLLELEEHARTWDRYWGRSGAYPDVVFQSNSIEAVRTMVGAGHGVTILSDLVFRPWSLEGDYLCRRDLDDAIPGMRVGCIRPASSGQEELAEIFVEAVRRQLTGEAGTDHRRRA